MRQLLLAVCLATWIASADDSLTVRPDLWGMVDRYLTSVAERHWSERDRTIASIRDARDVHSRQDYIRKTILAEIGGFPDRTPLNARVTGRLERDGYSIEMVIYESQPRYYVTGNVYIPASGSRPFAAVLGTAGHSDDGKAYEVYQRMWIALAKRGFLVLAIDPPGQGERLEYFDPSQRKSLLGPGVPEHEMAGAQCFLTGTNLARWEIWDGIRGIDYLLSRPDVDAKRLAVIGNSGGGTQAAYLAALDSRLAAAVPSCYITSWKNLWSAPGPQDAEQNFAGFIRDGLDFPDFLVSFAPRPIRMLTATRDFFPIEGARATYAEASRLFHLIGAEDRVGFFEYNDTHGWSKPRREATAAWLERWLHNRQDDGAEPDFSTNAAADLNCTKTGQVSTSLAGETIRSMNRALAERMFAHRKALAATVSELRRLVAARLHLPSLRGAPHVAQAGSVARAGYRIQKLALDTEPGIVVPALLFVPDRAQNRAAATIILDPRGKQTAAQDDAVQALVHDGQVVMIPDLRGWGESAPAHKRNDYTAIWQTSMRALLVGRNLPGMQTYDALRVFDFLASRPEVDPARISIRGSGDGALVALFCAAMESRVHFIPTPVRSYMDAVKEDAPANLVSAIIPGVLSDFDVPDLQRLLARPAKAAGRKSQR
jgi:cephalosporin-C deacetylase-like acetyl esterase